MRTITALALAAALSLGGVAYAKGGGHGSRSSGYSSSGSGSHSISGYTRKNGTYVAPSHATNPNRTKTDNWSSKPNTNPYTGKQGTKDPYAPSKR